MPVGDVISAASPCPTSRNVTTSSPALATEGSHSKLKTRVNSQRHTPTQYREPAPNCRRRTTSWAVLSLTAWNNGDSQDSSDDSGNYEPMNAQQHGSRFSTSPPKSCADFFTICRDRTSRNETTGKPLRLRPSTAEMLLDRSAVLLLPLAAWLSPPANDQKSRAAGDELRPKIPSAASVTRTF